jgi:hypothetical protein
MNRQGDVALSAVVISTVTGQGIWSTATGSLQMVVRNGSPFPPGAPGEIFTTQFVLNQDPVALNDLGQIAHVAVLQGTTVTPQNNTAIVVHGPSGVELYLREGNAAPETEIGTVFTGFYLPRLNNAGEIAFVGFVDSSNENRSGIWAGAKDNLQLIVREGDFAPGTTTPTTFHQFDSLRSQPSFNDAGQIAFAARLRGPAVNSSNDMGIWGVSSLGELLLVAREGDAIEVTPNDFRVIETLNPSAVDPDAVLPVHLNARGQIAFHARFVDGTEGLFLSNALAVPEPSSIGMVLSLLLLANPRARRSVLSRP